MTPQDQALSPAATEVLELATADLDQVVGGGSGLTKAGPGTLVLSGGNTYRGTTTVNEGTLV